MKKTILSLSALFLLAFGALAFTANANNVTPQPVANGNGDEALYCSVTVGESHATCWFCNCAALAESLAN
jgi:hypothetical protein